MSRDNLQVYRFCRIAFEVISSPFLLNAVIRHHLYQFVKLHNVEEPATKYVSDTIENLYVDNVVMGVKDVHDACAYYKIMKELFNEAHMNLRE